ncbi:DUF229 domain-containing protein, partial [Halorubrum sp. SS5]
HQPYPRYGEMGEQFPELSRSPFALRREYRKGVQASAERFLERIGTLKNRGILDETLVIFLSDHGELLGEYGGFYGHILPATPELVHVPCTFIHPSLPTGESVDQLIQ